MEKVTRRRSAGRKKRERVVQVAAPYVERRVPFVEFASEEGLTRIENHADWIMQEVGLEFREDPEALRLWKDAGADVRETRVRLPKGMARALLATAPSSFVQHARNPERSVKIGDGCTVFSPVFGPPFVRDMKGGRRYGNIDDLTKLVKIVQMLPSLHHSGLVICEPCDLPVNKRHLDMILAHYRYSEKPTLGAITAMDRAQDSVEMARILFGAEFMENNVCVTANVNTNSPLLVDKVVTEAIRTYSAANQAMIVAPFILGGAMGPVTTAASIAQALAEAMTCGAFTQLVRKGAPFVLGNFLSSMSLRSGAPTFGMPEPVASNYVIGQLARRLNLPLRCGGSLTASKLPDAQAAFESADSMHSTIMGGGNFIIHSAGWLEGGLVAGFEKLVIDADRLGAYQVLMQGLPTDDNALGKQAYDDVEPAGHFLGSAHTMANYETAYYDPALSDSESFEQWEEKGAKDTMTRAYERWNTLLDEYEQPYLDPGKAEALADYVARRKAAMSDDWY